MCGFLTIVGDRFNDSFDAAVDTLARRGPDARGTWHGSGVHLGHRRLSIIDLEGGAQPFASDDGRYRLTYNGELYNFRELRDELTRQGIVFHSSSDTEVLLKACITWGTDALAKFDGIFGFALWDDRERTLLVARDRMGVKPVFYSTHKGFVAASTVAPFWALEGFSRKADYHALREYLVQGYISSPRTVLAHVRNLEPGTWLRYHADVQRLEQGRYWDIPHATDAPLTVDDLIEQADAALRESVRRQLVADVPIGVIFSGGIDSSLVAHYMAETSGEPIRTFTVKFDQSRKHDEAPIAKRVAEALGAEHHEYFAGQLSEQQFVSEIAQMDQPIGDASLLPVMMLSELTREHVKVALGGDGGDELFGGYDRYLRGEDAYPGSPVAGAMRKAAESRLLPASLYRSTLRGADRVKRHYSRMGDYPVSDRSLAAVVDAGHAERFALHDAMADWEQSIRRFTGKLDSDSMMRGDAWHFLAQNCLMKTDRASMARSLEVRVPMLGNPVVDLVLPQPASVKLSRGLKTVLTALAQRYLPADVWDRPKRGFTVPVEHYLTQTWRRYCDDLMARVAEIAPCLDAAEIQRRWAVHMRGGKVDWPIYSIVVLLGWLDTHRLDFD